jgi:group II intron reverse transcriptase/maturase
LSPPIQWIADKAAADASFVFQTLAHRMDVPLLYEAYRQVRKDGAAGVDGETGRSYSEHLEEHIKNLHQRLRTKQYRAPNVRRVWIDKEDGRQRPLGIPTFEDKIVQRAVVMLLEPIFEADFHEHSFGFRPGRGAHDALKTLREECQTQRVQWILDVDIQGFFDTIDHTQLIELLHRRVQDGGIDRLIGKWLNAGILDGQTLTHPTKGTPQGGVISPLLANIYLHYVLDEWFAKEIQPRLSGRSFLVRYADDFVLGFETESDAKRVLAVLAKRLGKYGLRIHPEKTRLLPFKRPPSTDEKDRSNGTFDFLGFTHYWCRSRQGY